MSETVLRTQRQALAELGACALRTGDLDVLLQEACRLVADGMATRFCKVLEYLPNGNCLLVRAGVGWRDGVVGHATLEADNGSPAGHALRTGQPVITNDLPRETRFRTPDLLLEHGIERAINVIIQGDGKPFGVLEADSLRPGSFSEDAIAFLQAAADLIGVALERSRRVADLEQALEARGLLIREADHRIKNSLQLIASLLTMQRSRLADPGTQAALDEAIARVRAVAASHRALHESIDLRTIAFGRMLADLSQHVSDLSPTVQIECRIDDALELDAERAIPLGLIVSELLTNASQHAYPGGRHGVVRVSAHVSDDNIDISVVDEGIGLRAEGLGGKGLGGVIVRSLVKQIGAEFRIDSAAGAGTSVFLRIPRSAACEPTRTDA